MTSPEAAASAALSRHTPRHVRLNSPSSRITLLEKGPRAEVESVAFIQIIELRPLDQRRSRR